MTQVQLGNINDGLMWSQRAMVSTCIDFQLFRLEELGAKMWARVTRFSCYRSLKYPPAEDELMCEHSQHVHHGGAHEHARSGGFRKPHSFLVTRARCSPLAEILDLAG